MFVLSRQIKIESTILREYEIKIMKFSLSTIFFSKLILMADLQSSTFFKCHERGNSGP